MGVVAAAVDRAFERSTRSTGQARKDELLNLPLPVAHRDRPRLELLVRDVLPDLGSAGFNHRRGDRQRLGDRRDFELEVERQCLGGVKRDLVGLGRPEPGRFDPDAV